MCWRCPSPRWRWASRSICCWRASGLRAFGGGRAGLLALLVSAVALGGLYAINGWDLPTYLGLALLALAIQQWLAHERRFTTALLADFWRCAVAGRAVSCLLYLPFYRDFSSPGEGMGLVPADARTPIGYEVAIFGLPLFVILSLAVLRLARRWPAPGAQVGLAVALVLALGSWLAPTLPIWTCSGRYCLSQCAPISRRVCSDCDLAARHLWILWRACA